MVDYLGVDLWCRPGLVVSSDSLAGHLQYGSVELPIPMAGHPAAVGCGMGLLFLPYSLRGIPIHPARADLPGF
ncbi:hypothetical protein D3C84_670250 [compost metagenome]